MLIIMLYQGFWADAARSHSFSGWSHIPDTPRPFEHVKHAFSAKDGSCRRLSKESMAAGHRDVMIQGGEGE